MISCTSLAAAEAIQKRSNVVPIIFPQLFNFHFFNNCQNFHFLLHRFLKLLFIPRSGKMIKHFQKAHPAHLEIFCHMLMEEDPASTRAYCCLRSLSPTLIPVFLSRLAALSPAVEAAAVAVVAVVTVTQGVDPQDPPTHSQYDFTLTSST